MYQVLIPRLCTKLVHRKGIRVYVDWQRTTHLASRFQPETDAQVFHAIQCKERVKRLPNLLF